MKFAILVVALVCIQCMEAVQFQVLPAQSGGLFNVHDLQKPIFTNEGDAQISNLPGSLNDVVISNKPIFSNQGDAQISNLPGLVDDVVISNKPIFSNEESLADSSNDACNVCFTQLKELAAELTRAFV